MDNIKILIILLLILLFLENKNNNDNDKDVLINYLTKGVLIYVTICLLTKKKQENFTLTNYRQNLKKHLKYLREELSDKMVLISDEKNNQYTAKIIFSIDSDKIINMCVGANKHNIFNNVSNMCPKLDKYINNKIHIFAWNIETKLNRMNNRVNKNSNNKSRDITRRIRKLPDNCTFNQENLDLSKIDLSCKYYNLEGGFIDAVDCNLVDNNECKVNDSPSYRNETILNYKLSIPENTILVVYYYKSDKYKSPRNEYNEYEISKTGMSVLIKPYSIIFVENQINNISLLQIIKNHKYKYDNNLERVIDSNYFPIDNIETENKDIIKKIAGFKFINLNITNNENWNDFKNNNNILKLKDNMSTIVINKNYDYIENNTRIKRKQKQKQKIYRKSFKDYCPS